MFMEKCPMFFLPLSSLWTHRRKNNCANLAWTVQSYCFAESASHILPFYVGKDNFYYTPRVATNKL